jgi:hypothetical protein
MSLISAANLLAYVDRLADGYTQTLNAIGTKTGNPVLGNVRGTLNALLNQVVAINDADQELDLILGVTNALNNTNAEAAVNLWAAGALSTLNSHIARLGGTVNASIVNLSTFLTYYNTTPFSYLITPDGAKLYSTLSQNPSTLAPGNVMSPGINPVLNPAGSAYGMGSYDVATTTGNVGDPVLNTTYSCVVPVIEVITAFVGGGAAPIVLLTGKDDLGATVTYTKTLTGNNPTGPLSGITVTPGITIAARQTVALSSVTGIVVGSVLVINKGLPDTETIVVEAVPATTITAVFKLAHSAGATVDGYATYPAGNASTGANRRLQRLTVAPSLTLSSHSAGGVRCSGVQDRVAI